MQGFIYWCAALKPLGIGNWRYALWQSMLLWCLVARKSILGAWKLCLKIEGCSFHCIVERVSFFRKEIHESDFMHFIHFKWTAHLLPWFWTLRWLPWPRSTASLDAAAMACCRARKWQEAGLGFCNSRGIFKGSRDQKRTNWGFSSFTPFTKNLPF